MNDEIVIITTAMLKHAEGQNIGVAVGATLNVLMTLLNYAPDKAMRDGIVKHLHIIADQVAAIDEVKQ